MIFNTDHNFYRISITELVSLHPLVHVFALLLLPIRKLKATNFE
jgi:hypothetical protein